MGYNLIINFGGQSWQTAGLQDRIASKGGRSDVLNLSHEDLKGELSPEKLALLQKVDHCSRVYIIDHSNPNSTRIVSAHYQELADFLAKNISDETVRTKDSKLRFSLIACNAATGEKEGLKSFAGLFHRYLGQQHHIHCEVTARTRLAIVAPTVKHSGKETTSLLQYSAMVAAASLKIPKPLYDPENHKEHQKAGSKISFQWDEHGDQLVVDSYVHKYFLHTADVITLMGEAIPGSRLDESATKELMKMQSELILLATDWQSKEVVDLVKEINDRLNKIDAIFAKTENTKALLVRDAIKAALKKSSTSIDSDSKTAVHSEFNILGIIQEEEKPIDIKIRELVVQPIIDLLKALPKTAREKPIKKTCQAFLQLLSDRGSRELKKEEDFEHELNISRFIENTLLRILTPEMSKDEKAASIFEMYDLIASELISNLKTSGAFEGYKEATKLGGLTGLKSFIPLISLRSKEKRAHLEDLKEKLDSFTRALLEYL